MSISWSVVSDVTFMWPLSDENISVFSGFFLSSSKMSWAGIERYDDGINAIFLDLKMSPGFNVSRYLSRYARLSCDAKVRSWKYA